MVKVGSFKPYVDKGLLGHLVFGLLTALLFMCAPLFSVSNFLSFPFSFAYVLRFFSLLFILG